MSLQLCQTDIKKEPCFMYFTMRPIKLWKRMTSVILESIIVKSLFFKQSLAGFEQDSERIEQGFARLKQCSAYYLGSNRIL